MKIFFFLLASLIPLFSFAQEVKRDSTRQAKSAVDLGVGLGLDYGGFGARLTVFPEKHIGLFGALGYAAVGAGYNAGLKFRTNPNKRVCFVTGGMYGYNAVIAVSGASRYNKIYDGPSIFAGFEIHSRVKPKSFVSVELIVPFRSTQFDNDLHQLQSNPTIKINDPLPIALSFGFHFGF